MYDSIRTSRISAHHSLPSSLSVIFANFDDMPHVEH
jgi:hypothetical protein